MAVTATPIFVQTVQCSQDSTATGNSARDGSGTISTLLSAGANGTKVFTLKATWEVTSTAGSLRIYISDDDATWGVLEDIPVTAITVSASQVAWQWEKSYDNLVLGPTGMIGFAPHASEAVTVVATYGDY